MVQADRQADMYVGRGQSQTPPENSGEGLSSVHGHVLTLLPGHRRSLAPSQQWSYVWTWLGHPLTLISCLLPDENIQLLSGFQKPPCSDPPRPHISPQDIPHYFQCRLLPHFLPLCPPSTSVFISDTSLPLLYLRICLPHRLAASQGTECGISPQICFPSLGL